MWPTSAMAKSTMRRDRPPVFITSPASMKKGTASSGKLSAPLMTFCARICASNMSMCHISAAPHSSREKAIGMPSAMAPSSEKRKTAMVMMELPSRSLHGLGNVRRLFLGLPDADQLGLGELVVDQAPQVVEQNDRA